MLALVFGFGYSWKEFREFVQKQQEKSNNEQIKRNK